MQSYSHHRVCQPCKIHLTSSMHKTTWQSQTRQMQIIPCTDLAGVRDRCHGLQPCNIEGLPRNTGTCWHLIFALHTLLHHYTRGASSVSWSCHQRVQMCGKVVYHAMLMLNRLHRWCICYNTVKKLPMSQKHYQVCSMCNAANHCWYIHWTTWNACSPSTMHQLSWWAKLLEE